MCANSPDCSSRGIRVEDASVSGPGSLALRAAIEVARASAESWATVFAKERVVRREVDLGFDTADYTASDYDAVAHYMAPLEAEASRARLTASGLRWCYHGDAVLFEMTRILNAPYDAFVERVDIASAIRICLLYTSPSPRDS